MATSSETSRVALSGTPSRPRAASVASTKRRASDALAGSAGNEVRASDGAVIGGAPRAPQRRSRLPSPFPPARSHRPLHHKLATCHSPTREPSAEAGGGAVLRHRVLAVPKPATGYLTRSRGVRIRSTASP